jgi:hypothetical protein
MSDLRIIIGENEFRARFESEKSPDTCKTFKSALPFVSKIIHARWSGEAVWIPLGDLQFGVGYEDATSYPAPGQIILFPRGISETEILIAYGPTCFASKAGQLAGNHFLTIEDNLDVLAELGRGTLWSGAKDIQFVAP